MTDLPPLTSDISNAAWLHTVMLRAAEAHHAGDRTGVERVRQHVAEQGGPQLLNIVDKAFEGAAIATAVTALKVGGVTVPMGAALPNSKICDFCSDLKVVAYYPFERFTIADPAGMAVEWDSGDRWYVCERCRGFVDADSWKELRVWVGPGEKANRRLWYGFQQHRTGPAIPYVPGD